MKNISPPVLYYHAVGEGVPEGWKQHAGLIVDATVLEDQFHFLRARKYRTLFLEDWLPYRKGDKPSDGRTVCLTFDDGLLDNWVYAYPLAKKYGVRITLFVSPECVDPRPVVRPNLEDVWNGRCRHEELEVLGYASWAELRAMQASGWVDVQSHTMSHLKYPASPEISGFYYGGPAGIYPILTASPEIKPSYMTDPDFGKRLPLGAPLFEERSSVIVRKHEVNPDFLQETKDLAAGFDLTDPEQRPAYEKKARALHQACRERGKLIAGIETEEDFQARLHYEIIDSKNILEEKLSKPVEFLCWPHGDNSHQAHHLALEAGYRATTSGKLKSEATHTDRIPRIGAGFRGRRYMAHQKFRYKLGGHYQQEPYYTLLRINNLRHRWLK